MHNHEKKGRKPPIMKQKLKQCRKMNLSSHKNQSTQVMHGLRTMKKKKKLTSYEEESETVFLAELRYRLAKVFYGLKVISKQS